MDWDRIRQAHSVQQRRICHYATDERTRFSTYINPFDAVIELIAD